MCACARSGQLQQGGPGHSRAGGRRSRGLLLSHLLQDVQGPCHALHRADVSAVPSPELLELEDISPVPWPQDFLQCQAPSRSLVQKAHLHTERGDGGWLTGVVYASVPWQARHAGGIPAQLLLTIACYWTFAAPCAANQMQIIPSQGLCAALT